MDSAEDVATLPATGFPIQKSPDQSLFSSSPKLIAAFHVFHRLLTPRHPPFALNSLATKYLTQILRTHFFKFDIQIVKEQKTIDAVLFLVEVNGFEPMTSCVQGRRSPKLSYTPEKRPRKWWAWMDLNHRPHAYQACALTELSYRPSHNPSSLSAFLVN